VLDVTSGKVLDMERIRDKSRTIRRGGEDTSVSILRIGVE
jgi:hypothetical protein